jgi:hypothetical protein
MPRRRARAARRISRQDFRRARQSQPRPAARSLRKRVIGMIEVISSTPEKRRGAAKQSRRTGFGTNWNNDAHCFPLATNGEPSRFSGEGMKLRHAARSKAKKHGQHRKRKTTQAPSGRLHPTPGNTKPSFRAGLLTRRHPPSAPSRADSFAQWRSPKSSGLQQRGLCRTVRARSNAQNHRLPVSPAPRSRSKAPENSRHSIPVSFGVKCSEDRGQRTVQLPGAKRPQELLNPAT